MTAIMTDADFIILCVCALVWGLMSGCILGKSISVLDADDFFGTVIIWTCITATITAAIVFGLTSG